MGPHGEGHLDANKSKTNKFTPEPAQESRDLLTKRNGEDDPSKPKLSLVQVEEDKHARVFNHSADHTAVWDGEVSGQRRLRGVLDFYGYAFALSMDRQQWRKQWVGGKTGYAAYGKLSFKLLRYPQDEKDQVTKGRKKYKGKTKMCGQNIGLAGCLQKGWAATVELDGWWNDQTMHFTGKAITPYDGKDNMLDWLNHAMLPWREIDMRFDNTGAHCRFDWYENKESFGDYFNIFASSDRRWKFGIFRLDALPPNQDESRVYVGQIFTRKVLSVVTLRLNDCTTAKDGGFVCDLEQRPLMVSDDTNNNTLVLYDSPPFGSTGKGNWFVFIGMTGYLNLEFKPEPHGNYVATPQSSECWGNVPCPFIVSEPFAAQFQQKLVVLHQANAAVEGGANAVASSFLLYPIYDDMVMSANTDITNQQGWNPATQSLPRDCKDANDKFCLKIGGDDDAPDSPEAETSDQGKQGGDTHIYNGPVTIHNGDVSGNVNHGESGDSKKQRKKIKRLERKNDELEAQLDSMKSMRKKVDEKDDQIAEWKAKYAALQKRDAEEARKIAKEQHVDLEPGQTVVVSTPAQRKGGNNAMNSESDNLSSSSSSD